ncbi:MAG: nucleotide exchange factor GrpE [Thiothrix sp.]|nr:MAG: nucleotide exchange factor GrpE [Thiothrix sp.]
MQDNEHPEKDSQPKKEVSGHLDDTVKILPVEEDLQQLSEELEASKARAQENWDRLLRVQAENDNLRKRSERDIENAHKYALEGFAKDLLPVKDSLEMGLVAAQTDSDEGNLKEGAEMTLKMFSDIFEKHGIKVVDPEGEPFNPDHHQAMTMQEDADLEPNTVVTVMQKGYLLNDRLIRPAMVVVSKLPG